MHTIYVKFRFYSSVKQKFLNIGAFVDNLVCDSFQFVINIFVEYETKNSDFDKSH